MIVGCLFKITVALACYGSFCNGIYIDILIVIIGIAVYCLSFLNEFLDRTKFCCGCQDSSTFHTPTPA